MDGGKTNAVGRKTDVPGNDIRVVPFRGKGGDGAGRALHHEIRPGIVQIDAAPVTLGKDFLLGGGIFLHAAVQVQMVLREVCEHGHIEVDARHPLQGQGMGGHLHHHMGAAGVLHGTEQPVQLIAFRGGKLAVQMLLADHVAVGADQPHLGPQLLLQ